MLLDVAKQPMLLGVVGTRKPSRDHLEDLALIPGREEFSDDRIVAFAIDAKVQMKAARPVVVVGEEERIEKHVERPVGVSYSRGKSQEPGRAQADPTMDIGFSGSKDQSMKNPKNKFHSSRPRRVLSVPISIRNPMDQEVDLPGPLAFAFRISALHVAQGHPELCVGRIEGDVRLERSGENHECRGKEDARVITPGR
jgi:hypothetical protein